VTLYVRNRRPAYLEVGVAQTASISVESDGAAIAAPSVATYTLRDATGAAVSGLSAVSATPAAGGASYAVGASALNSATKGPSFAEEWALTIASVVYTFRIEAVVCLVRPYCPFTVADLTRCLPELSDDYLRPAGWTSWADPIEEAWDEVTGRLLEHGQPVHQIVGMGRLRRVVQRTVRLNIATQLAMSRDGTSRWADLAAILGAPATEPRSLEAAWTQALLRLDRDDDHAPDTDDEEEIRPGVYGSALVPAAPSPAVVGRFF
jgi:hypothetical protein